MNDNINTIFTVLDTDNYDTKQRKLDEVKIRSLNPKIGQWANLNYHYPSVWSKICYTYLPNDYFGHIKVYRDDGDKIIEEWVYFNKIRNIVSELPSNASCAIDENGRRDLHK